MFLRCSSCVAASSVRRAARAPVAGTLVRRGFLDGTTYLLLPATLSIAAVAESVPCRPLLADEEQLSGAERLMSEDLVEVRRVVRTISTNTGRDPDAWVMRAREAFSAVAGPDGTLGSEEVHNALEMLMASCGDVGLPWELAPLLFRLLDADHDGRVTLKDFLMGQALLFSAARSGSAQQLGEVCWRALDIAGSGSISSREMGVAVGLMLQLGSIDPKHLSQIKARLGAKQIARSDDWAKKGRKGRSVGTLQLEAVQFYMEMYDPAGKGNVTRKEFERCGALQENFRRMLTNEKLTPIFLAHEMSAGATRAEKRIRVNLPSS